MRNFSSKKLVFCLAGLLTLGQVRLASASASSILGDWNYDGYEYQGKRYPLPNPKLKLVFTFSADGTERLYWKRSDESGFCERRGTWSLKDGALVQNTTWLNPDNDSQCAQDPDMQPGRSTVNRIELSDSELGLHMDLNGQDFLYLLIRSTTAE